ncbi:hypothetical protein BpHYR1_045358 [Brachionus plicatilis]|uniref:Uncharacterized protein n=1 Tax=Brachionus plicatilis TaxID=10195 RepID=A0A3M7R6T1_BRAPC|nr:hypothetical protein BpHYR1_045358 [Brachionus plicatilis]
MVFFNILFWKGPFFKRSFSRSFFGKVL